MGTGVAKNQKDFWWEVLIITLGILLAYVAQTFIKFDSDRVSAKKYTIAIREDLRKDSIELIRIKGKREQRESKFLSLLKILDEPNYKSRAREVYQLVKESDEYETFLRTDRTLQTLKYTGNFNLLDRDEVDDILKYDNYLIAEVDWNNYTERNRIDNYKRNRSLLLNVASLERIYQNDTAGKFFLNDIAKRDFDIIKGDIFQVLQISRTCKHSEQTAVEMARDLLGSID